MKLEGLAEEIMASMHIANPHHLKKALRREGHSGYVYAQKILNNLVYLGKLERREKLYALPSCKSEGKEHALAVSDHIAQIFNKFDRPIVYREHLIENVSIKPDLLAFCPRGDKALCFCLEVVLEEPPEYLAMKRTVWAHWNEATQYLTNLFGHNVHWIDFITSMEWPAYLEEIL